MNRKFLRTAMAGVMLAAFGTASLVCAPAIASG